MSDFLARMVSTVEAAEHSSFDKVLRKGDLLDALTDPERLVVELRPAFFSMTVS